MKLVIPSCDVCGCLVAKYHLEKTYSLGEVKNKKLGVDICENCWKAITTKHKPRKWWQFWRKK